MAQFNNTPSWRLAKYSESRLPASPMELFYSQPCNGNMLDELLGHLSYSQQGKYKDIYKKIIGEFDDEMEKQHNLEIKNLKVGTSLSPGDIVMIMNPKRIHHEVEGKGKELFLKDLWEIIQINHSKATLAPLFFKSRKCEKVYVDHLKKYEPQMLVQLLPDEIQGLMGHYHNPEVLKRTRRPPSVFERKVPLRNFPSLRNRIENDDDKHSIPAIRGPIYEDDEMDDYDDPLFPLPGPNYTQIKYDKLIIPDDPNLYPQGPDVPPNLGGTSGSGGRLVTDDPHGSNDLDDSQTPPGASADATRLSLIAKRMEEQHAANTSLRQLDGGNQTLATGNLRDYEIRDESIKPDTPNTVMRKLKGDNDLNQEKKHIEWSSNKHQRTYLNSKAEKDFKRGQQTFLGKAKDRISDFIMGGSSYMPSYKDVIQDNQSKLDPFQPGHESSPKKAGFNLNSGNAWNQLSPIKPKGGILKQHNDSTFQNTLPTDGNRQHDSLDESNYMGRRRSPKQSFDSSGNDTYFSPNTSLDDTLNGEKFATPQRFSGSTPPTRRTTPQITHQRYPGSTPPRFGGTPQIRHQHPGTPQVRGPPPPPPAGSATRKRTPAGRGTPRHMSVSTPGLTPTQPNSGKSPRLRQPYQKTLGNHSGMDDLIQGLGNVNFTKSASANNENEPYITRKGRKVVPPDRYVPM